MGTWGFGIFDNDDAMDFVGDLRDAPPAEVGDRISAALRAAAQAEDGLTPSEVGSALVALALLLSEYQPDVLRSEPYAKDLPEWFAGLEIELNPARRQIATAALNRILLPEDNEWQDAIAESGNAAEALAPVLRLRDVLADSAADE